MSPPLFVRMLLSSNPMNVFIDSAISLVVDLATKLSIFLLFVGIILLLYNVVLGVLDNKIKTEGVAHYFYNISLLPIMTSKQIKRILIETSVPPTLVRRFLLCIFR